MKKVVYFLDISDYPKFMKLRQVLRILLPISTDVETDLSFYKNDISNVVIVTFEVPKDVNVPMDYEFLTHLCRVCGVELIRALVL